LIYSYLKYLFTAKNADKIHSPFVFDWYYHHLNPSKIYYAFKEINDLRNNLENDKRMVEISNLGAKSSAIRQNTKLSQIAKNNSIPHRYGRILFEIAQRSAANYILEIGTCIGLSSLYLAKGNSQSKLITLEGHAPYANIAREVFKVAQANNIELIQGDFETKLPAVLQKLKRLDLVFFDGNHRYMPTISYFEQCLKLKHEQSIFIFDDIHWSKEMEKAWEEIKRHPDVSITLDFFRLGVVFFRKGIVKQNFVLRY